MRYYVYLSLNAQGMSETGIFYIEKEILKGKGYLGWRKKKIEAEIKKTSVQSFKEGSWSKVSTSLCTTPKFLFMSIIWDQILQKKK